MIAQIVQPPTTATARPNRLLSISVIAIASKTDTAAVCLCKNAATSNATVKTTARADSAR
ncbi:MAG: hypothetical protein ACLPT4_11535 [Verrucomicrobiia bacterium]